MIITSLDCILDIKIIILYQYNIGSDILFFGLNL